MATTKLTLSNGRFEQTTGDTLNLSGNTIVYGGLLHSGNSNFSNGNSFITKNYVLNTTGTTLITEITTSAYTISNFDKSYYLYCVYTGVTNIYIPDTVNTGLTFTTVRASGAGVVTHTPTGTSVLNISSDNTNILIENGASTWQYIGNSEWYGYGSLGTPISGGSSITANNGITKSGDNIYLGGDLTGITTINSTSSNFNIYGDNTLFEINQDGAAPTNIVTSLNGINIADGSGVGLTYQSADNLGNYVIATVLPDSYTVDGSTGFHGIEYVSNFAANFRPRSLIDKAYVTGATYLSASNGITKTGSKFLLGGTVTGNTTINSNVDNTNSFSIGSNAARFATISLSAGQSGVNSGAISVTSTSTSISRSATNPASIVLDSSAIRITDLLNMRGVIYADNYSSNFTTRSLVDKGYVTGITSTLVATANNGLTKSGTNIHLGGALTGNTTINGSTFDFVISNSSTLFSVKSNAIQLNLSGDTTNDIYSRNSSGNLQRIAAGTGSTVLMMNTGGTAHQYSKIITDNIANSAVTIPKLANSGGGTRIIGRSQSSAGAYGEIAATADGQSLRRVGGVLGFGNCSTVSFTVGTLPAATTAGQMIYVSDESGGAVIAFSDGTNWRRVTDRAIVS